MGNILPHVNTAKEFICQMVWHYRTKPTLFYIFLVPKELRNALVWKYFFNFKLQKKKCKANSILFCGKHVHYVRYAFKCPTNRKFSIELLADYLADGHLTRIKEYSASVLCQQSLYDIVCMITFTNTLTHSKYSFIFHVFFFVLLSFLAFFFFTCLFIYLYVCMYEYINQYKGPVFGARLLDY